MGIEAIKTNFCTLTHTKTYINPFSTHIGKSIHDPVANVRIFGIILAIHGKDIKVWPAASVKDGRFQKKKIETL
jgi:hypothetical protein